MIGCFCTTWAKFVSCDWLFLHHGSKISVTELVICGCLGIFDIRSNLKTWREEGLFEGLTINTRNEYLSLNIHRFFNLTKHYTYQSTKILWRRRWWAGLGTTAVRGIWNERDSPRRSNRVPAVRIRGLATKPDSLSCSNGRGDSATTKCVTEHPGLFPLSSFWHDVAEEPSVFLVDSEQ